MKKNYIYITRKLPEQLIAPLRSIAEVNMWEEDNVPVPAEILQNEAKKAHGLLTMLTDKIEQDLLEQAPHLKVIANMAVGYDNIDIDAANKRGIIVCNTPDVLTNTTADLTFGLMLATARRIVEAAEFVKQGKWVNWSPFLLAGQDLFKKKLGIVGMGRIGQAVAKRASGFDMEVSYHNRNRNVEAETTYGATYKTFDELISESDYIVCLTPLTAETTKLFNKAIFKKMKRSAIFINVSRGGVVCEQSLYEALLQKEIGGAGLDVFQQEPIDNTHPLLSLPNVVALPHIGSASEETRTIMAKLACENITRVLTGEKPKTAIIN